MKKKIVMGEHYARIIIAALRCGIDPTDPWYVLLHNGARGFPAAMKSMLETPLQEEYRWEPTDEEGDVLWSIRFYPAGEIWEAHGGKDDIVVMEYDDTDADCDAAAARLVAIGGIDRTYAFNPHLSQRKALQLLEKNTLPCWCKRCKEGYYNKRVFTWRYSASTSSSPRADR